MVLIGPAGSSAGAGTIFAFGLVAFSGHLAWQVWRLDIDDPALCLDLFKSNRDAGLVLFAALVFDAAFRFRNAGPAKPVGIVRGAQAVDPVTKRSPPRAAC